MSQLMLFEVLGVLTDFTTSFALKRRVFRIASSNIVGGRQYREEVLTVLSGWGTAGGVVGDHIRAEDGMFQLQVMLQHLLGGELVPTLTAGQVVLLLVHGEVALETGQAAEGLPTLWTLQPGSSLVAGSVKLHILLQVVGDPTVLTPAGNIS